MLLAINASHFLEDKVELKMWQERADIYGKVFGGAGSGGGSGKTSFGPDPGQPGSRTGARSTALSSAGRGDSVVSRNISNVFGGTVNGVGPSQGQGNAISGKPPTPSITSRTISNVHGGTVNGVGPNPNPGVPVSAGPGTETHMRLTADGLLIQPGMISGSTDQQGGAASADRQAQEEQARIPPTPAKPVEPAPLPKVENRQRAASLARPQPEDEPRTLLNLPLANVTRKSLLGF